jgi:hypothetical protein
MLITDVKLEGNSKIVPTGPVAVHLLLLGSERDTVESYSSYLERYVVLLR